MVVSFVSDDFKVEWKDPADAAATWLYDPVHFPRPLTPFAADFLERMYEGYMSSRTILVNGFAFSTMPTPRPPTPEIMQRGAADVFLNDYVPLIRDFCHRVRSAGYETMSLAELGAEVERLMAEASHTFGYTMKVISGFMGPTFGFVHMLQEALGPDAPQVAATLLQGFENGTAAAGAGLSDLAQEAARSPAVAEALRNGRYDNLEALEGGSQFMRRFRSFLDEYGWRVESWGLPEVPTWSEDPHTPLMLIGRYLADPERTPAAAITRAISQREAATREVESRLAPEMLPRFREALKEVQAHVPVSEGRALWQLLIIGSLRVPVLAIGRKLVGAGALASPDDAFYFTAAELRHAADAPGPQVKETAASRRADYDSWRQMTPPPFLGTPPDIAAAPPEVQALAILFFGAGVPDVQGREIKGQAASRGVVRARARIVHSLAEAERLQQGEVLVCATTAPPWTPLFAIASAVVTDSGGVLSHSAICAREYAIPCVVATQVATHVIPDGAMVTVDGTKGIVTIEG